jgi:NADH:ubiquinone oxidoreductase subunit K
MKFVRPSWLAIYISLGMMLSGYVLSLEFVGDKSTSEGQMLFVLLMFVMTLAGALGFVLSLIWWFIAALKSRKSTPH